MPKRDPERTCIVTREPGAPDELMRFVLAPDGTVTADLRGRLPGRGAWVTPTAARVAEAMRRKLFARAFKSEVAVPAGLVEAIDAALVRDLRGSLSLANKAGAVLTGFAKVESAVRAGGVAALIHAREAAEDGRRKLLGALRSREGAPISATAVLDDLPEDDLDMALGRPHVIHAALLAGPGSQGCLARWRRLRVFRGVEQPAEIPRDVDDRQGRARDTGRQDSKLYE